MMKPLVIVGALSVASPALAEQTGVFTCDEFDRVRSESDAGNQGSLGFIRGWMTGVMNMAGAQIEVEKRDDGRLTFCPKVGPTEPYMSYDRLLAVYDKMMADPQVKAFRTKSPGLCAPETVVLLGFQREFPCN